MTLRLARSEDTDLKEFMGNPILKLLKEVHSKTGPESNYLRSPPDSEPSEGIQTEPTPHEGMSSEPEELPPILPGVSRPSTLVCQSYKEVPSLNCWPGDLPVEDSSPRGKGVIISSFLWAQPATSFCWSDSLLPGYRPGVLKSDSLVLALGMPLP